MELRTVNVTRYIMPLREGGSLPALAEADDSFKYVVKFRGAGHGTKALIAELIGGEVARVLGFRVPELVFLNLDEAFGRSEGDEEIQDLLQGSRGLNMGLHFLSGALPFDPVVTEVDEKLASQVVKNADPERVLKKDGQTNRTFVHNDSSFMISYEQRTDDPKEGRLLPSCDGAGLPAGSVSGIAYVAFLSLRFILISSWLIIRASCGNARR